MENNTEELTLDFTNYELAFKHYSNKELKEIARLFSLMNSNFLVNVGSDLTLLALKLHIPFVERIIRKTIFHHFCGGTNLLDCQTTIDRLWNDNVLTILDYGAEGVNSEEEYDKTIEELTRSIDFAAANDSTPIIVCKVSGIAHKELLEKVTLGKPLDKEEERSYSLLHERLVALCSRAEERKTGVFIDAEESWIQGAIDEITMKLMEQFNKSRVTVYKTYQLYRHDKLQELYDDYEYLRSSDSFLGAKIVRGAYMDQENAYAEKNDVPTVINPNKDITDNEFNKAITFCVTNYKYIGSCCGSHNAESNFLQANLIHEMGIHRDHPHLNFAQLFGMSDNLTYNLADEGYNVGKYVPYGKVREVIPYLIRRAKENASVTGDMSRELGMINNELIRRGLKH